MKEFLFLTDPAIEAKNIHQEQTMKIVRFLSEEGEICLGSIERDRQGEARIVRGDWFGKLELTGQTAHIRHLLAPLDPPNILAVGLNYGRHAEETNISRPW